MMPMWTTQQQQQQHHQAQPQQPHHQQQHRQSESGHYGHHQSFDERMAYHRQYQQHRTQARYNGDGYSNPNPSFGGQGQKQAPGETTGTMASMVSTLQQHHPTQQLHQMHQQPTPTTMDPTMACAAIAETLKKQQQHYPRQQQHGAEYASYCANYLQTQSTYNARQVSNEARRALADARLARSRALEGMISSSVGVGGDERAASGGTTWGQQGRQPLPYHQHHHQHPQHPLRPRAAPQAADVWGGAGGQKTQRRGRPGRQQQPQQRRRHPAPSSSSSSSWFVASPSLLPDGGIMGGYHTDATWDALMKGISVHDRITLQHVELLARRVSAAPAPDAAGRTSRYWQQQQPALREVRLRCRHCKASFEPARTAAGLGETIIRDVREAHFAVAADVDHPPADHPEPLHGRCGAMPADVVRRMKMSHGTRKYGKVALDAAYCASLLRKHGFAAPLLHMGQGFICIQQNGEKGIGLRNQPSDDEDDEEEVDYDEDDGGCYDDEEDDDEEEEEEDVEHVSPFSDIVDAVRDAFVALIKTDARSGGDGGGEDADPPDGVEQKEGGEEDIRLVDGEAMLPLSEAERGEESALLDGIGADIVDAAQGDGEGDGEGEGEGDGDGDGDGDGVVSVDATAAGAAASSVGSGPSAATREEDAQRSASGGDEEAVPKHTPTVRTGCLGCLFGNEGDDCKLCKNVKNDRYCVGSIDTDDGKRLFSLSDDPIWWESEESRIVGAVTFPHEDAGWFLRWLDDSLMMHEFAASGKKRRRVGFSEPVASKESLVMDLEAAPDLATLRLPPPFDEEEDGGDAGDGPSAAEASHAPGEVAYDGGFHHYYDGSCGVPALYGRYASDGMGNFQGSADNAGGIAVPPPMPNYAGGMAAVPPPMPNYVAPPMPTYAGGIAVSPLMPDYAGGMPPPVPNGAGGIAVPPSMPNDGGGIAVSPPVPNDVGWTAVPPPMHNDAGGTAVPPPMPNHAGGTAVPPPMHNDAGRTAVPPPMHNDANLHGDVVDLTLDDSSSSSSDANCGSFDAADGFDTCFGNGTCPEPGVGVQDDRKQEVSLPGSIRRIDVGGLTADQMYAVLDRLNHFPRPPTREERQKELESLFEGKPDDFELQLDLYLI